MLSQTFTGNDDTDGEKPAINHLINDQSKAFPRDDGTLGAVIEKDGHNRCPDVNDDVAAPFDEPDGGCISSATFLSNGDKPLILDSEATIKPPMDPTGLPPSSSSDCSGKPESCLTVTDDDFSQLPTDAAKSS